MWGLAADLHLDYEKYLVDLTRVKGSCLSNTRCVTYLQSPGHFIVWHRFHLDLMMRQTLAFPVIQVQEADKDTIKPVPPVELSLTGGMPAMLSPVDSC